MKARRSIVGQVANLRPIGNRPVATPKVFSKVVLGFQPCSPLSAGFFAGAPVGFCRLPIL
jgi:hypothetical protein